MHLQRAVLWLIGRIVPSACRGAWLEEWRAELRHARRSMILGALPDAWALRRITRERPPWSGRRSGVFHAFPQDVRYAIRGLMASRGFVAGVLLSLAIGIGANVVAFSFLNAGLFRRYPGVQKPRELAEIRLTTARGSAAKGLPMDPIHGDFEVNIARRMTTVTGVSAQRWTTLALFVRGEASAVPGALVSSNYFDVLGVRPAKGRFFVSSEDTPGTSAAVIGDAAWERLFARDPGAIGQTLSVNGAPLEIVGIAPRHFTGVRASPIDVWIPFGLAELTLRDGAGRPATVARSTRAWFEFVGRRRPGISMEQVQAEISVIADGADPSRRIKVRGEARDIWATDTKRASTAIVGFMAIPLLVLAIACVNAANLMLARASRQGRDWTVRLTLGATRWRVVRQVLTEASLLAVGGAALGMALAVWATDVLTTQFLFPMPIDIRVALFTVAITCISALAFSLGPALTVTADSAKRIVPASSTAPAPRSRGRFALVALQAALSLGLLTTGVQFMNTVLAGNPYVSNIPNPQRIVVAHFDLDPLRVQPGDGQGFYKQLGDRIRGLPGVTAAGVSVNEVVSGHLGSNSGLRIWLPDSPPEGDDNFSGVHLSPGALNALGLPLLQGSAFKDSDADALRSVIVNRTFAKKYFGAVAVGRSFRIADEGSPERVADVTVVGVADDVMKGAESRVAMLYYPVPLAYEPKQVLFVRVDDSGQFTAASIQTAVREVNARVPLGRITTLSESAPNTGGAFPRLLARGAAALGTLALLLAAGGLYSVVAYVVSMRRHEVGVRLALGADPGTVVRMIIRQALTPTLIGAAIGAAGAVAAARVIRANLFGASSLDPLAFTGAVLVMLVVMLVASWIPARQAGRVDPLSVLRQE